MAADYSQLELRVLAHLSKDQRLLQVRGLDAQKKNVTNVNKKRLRNDETVRLQVLNGGADVFRCIAAEWKSVDQESVNDDLRQQAKQVQPGRREKKTGHTAMLISPLCARVGFCRSAMASSTAWEPSL